MMYCPGKREWGLLGRIWVGQTGLDTLHVHDLANGIWPKIQQHIYEITNNTKIHLKETQSIPRKPGLLTNESN